MEFCCGPEKCVVCDVGTTRTSGSLQYDEFNMPAFIMEFSVCDHCGSELVNGAQMSMNKLRYLESEHIPHVSALNVLMKLHYNLSPHVYFDEHCDPKRSKVLLENKGKGSIAGELFDAQLALAASFREFDFVYSTGAGRSPFHYLAGLYGSLNQRFKEMKALLKKHAKQPEVVDYFRNLESCVLHWDVYAMMKDDFAAVQPVFDYRRKRDIERFPHHTFWEPLEIDWEVVNKNFKEAK